MKILGRVESWQGQQVNLSLDPLVISLLDFQNDIYQAKSDPNDPVDENRSSRRRLDYFAGTNSLIYFWFLFCFY